MSQKSKAVNSKEGKITKKDKSRENQYQSFVDDKCGTCSEIFVKDDDAIMCEICCIWFHPKCQDLPEGALELLGKSNIHWFCMKCDITMSKMIISIANLKEKQEYLENEMKETKEEVKEVKEELKCFKHEMKAMKDDIKKMPINTDDYNEVLKKDITSIRSELNEITKVTEEVRIVQNVVNTLENEIKEMKKEENKIEERLRPTWSNVVQREVDNKFQIMNGDLGKVKDTITSVKLEVEEERDKELRSHNLIIYRLPEVGSTKEEKKQHDREYCLDVFKNKLKIQVREEDFKAIFRLGKPNENSAVPRPLMVQFKDRILKNQIMESLHMLKSLEDTYRNISISHDLTKSQREVCKNLLVEAKAKTESSQGEYIWRVRGLPHSLKLVRMKVRN